MTKARLVHISAGKKQGDVSFDVMLYYIYEGTIGRKGFVTEALQGQKYRSFIPVALCPKPSS